MKASITAVAIAAPIRNMGTAGLSYSIEAISDEPAANDSRHVIPCRYVFRKGDAQVACAQRAGTARKAHVAVGIISIAARSCSSMCAFNTAFHVCNVVVRGQTMKALLSWIADIQLPVIAVAAQIASPVGNTEIAL